MTVLSDILASYVPKIVIRRLYQQPKPIAEAQFEHFKAAAMYADISGFTALTERLEQLPLAERGAGAEALTQVINSYFEQLINLILQHGGDIVKFTGDGLLALWPVMTSEEPRSMQNAVLLAGACGLKVQEALHDYSTDDGTHLSMRLGIGVGDVNILHLGGVFQRWEMLIAGEPILQTSKAEKLAGPGQVVISPEAHDLVRGRCSGRYLNLQRTDDGTPPSAPFQLVAIHEPVHFDGRMTLDASGLREASLRPYIPQAIYKHLDAGLSAWLAELRRVTVLFINIPELDHTVEDGLADAQRVMRDLQKAVYRYEGSINKLTVDDKGTTLVAAYGLPPLAHENDPERGAQASIAVYETLQEFGMRGAVGVASGLAFCGVIGSPLRREYTMMGDPVNLAARLMQAAGKLETGKAILSDLNTFQSAQEELKFESREPIALKGKSHPSPVFRPLGERSRRDQTERITGEWIKNLVGRLDERFTLAESLLALQRDAVGSVFVIEGEAGIGKSRLIQDLTEQAARLGVVHMMGAGNSIDRETPYLAWRPVFNQIFHLDEHSMLETRTSLQLPKILRMFTEMEIMHLAPLLNVVLNLGLEESEITSQMAGQVRAENTRRLLIQVLRQYTEDQPAALIIEDVQWIDSASWALLGEVFQEIKKILLVIATRPYTEPPPVEFERILSDRDTHHFVLSTLSFDETVDLVSRTLGVTEVPDAITKLIHQKAEGHPFYSQELAYSLRDNGILQFSNGNARIAPGANVSSLSFPDTVQGVITSRIDRLDPTEKLTLKVASVLGRTFLYPALHDIHPIPSDKDKIRSNLESLDRLEMTMLEQTEPELSYIFKHIITQEVSYNLMSFAQRQQLHEAAAGWYEQEYTDDLSPFYSLLAYHWNKAGVGEKAVEYYEKAGEEALLGGAYKEAISLFGEAIDWNRRRKPEPGGPMVRVTARLSIPEAQFKEARWFRKLGEAYLGLGQLPDSRLHLQTALEILGRSDALSPKRMIFGTVVQLFFQVLIRLMPADLFSAREVRQRGLAERARAYRNLGEISFFENETLSVIHSVLTVLNLNERIGESSELAEVYGNMGLICSFIPLHALARFYFRMARETAGRVDRLASKAYVELVNGLYLVGIGDWARVDEVVGEAVAINRRLGDQRRLGETLSIICMSEHLQANFRISIEKYEELYEIGAQAGNVQQETWGLDGQAINYLRLGDFEKAAELLDEARPRLEISQDVTESFIFQSIEAVLQMYLGEPLGALQCVRAALEMDVAASSVYSMLEGYAGITEVLTSLWESGFEPPFEYDFQATAEQVCKDFSGYARRFPMARPRALIWEGVQEWINGNHERAHGLWYSGLSAAQALNMPYEQGLAHKMMCLHGSVVSQKQKDHLSEARRIFEALDARADLERMR